MSALVSKGCGGVRISRNYGVALGLCCAGLDYAPSPVAAKGLERARPARVLLFLVHFCSLHMGDSMSKVREKRLSSQSGFFLMKCER